jgi:hypothetical protein
MGRGIFKRLVGSLEEVWKEVPDNRREGYDQLYGIGDAVKSTFAVFFFQHPSLLSFQRAMQEKRKRDNGETLRGVKEIPCDNEIRNLLDRIEPSKFKGVCNKNLETADKEGILDQYRVLDGGSINSVGRGLLLFIGGNTLQALFTPDKR